MDSFLFLFSNSWRALNGFFLISVFKFLEGFKLIFLLFLFTNSWRALN